MIDSRQSSLGRRAFLGGAAAGVGLWMARGFGAPGFGFVSEEISYEQTLRRLGQSLTARQRELVVFPSDHPTRQIINSQSIIERPHLGTLFSPQQRGWIEQLYRTMLSPHGIDAFAATIAVEGRFDGCILAIYGEPESGRAQTVIQGGHLMLRGGETSRDAAFGGGISYGHQIGNGLWRVPGNSFAYHGDAANRWLAQLTAAERQRAILAQAPHELILQVQSERGSFAGVRIGSLGEPARDAARQLLDVVFSPYPEAERAEALACIADHGGIDGLHFATYATHGFYEDMTAWGSIDASERARRGNPYWQVWRLEGPGTIIHFKGYPHVHAYLQVVRDPARVNLGASLATTDTTIEGASMRRLLEAALRRASGESLAFYGNDIPGRFCPGEITAGLAYALDPYRNRVAVATIAGKAMSPALREHLIQSGIGIDPEIRYRVVATDYVAQQPVLFGEPERLEPSRLLVRDALVEQLRVDGLGATRV